MTSGESRHWLRLVRVRHPERFGICISAAMICALLYVTLGDQNSRATGGGAFLVRQFPTGRPRVTVTCFESPSKQMSLAKPPFYPGNGTGVIVNTSEEFDTSHFNRFCDVRPALMAVLPVYSAVENFDRRKAIRDTIGRECELLNCKVMFIVGVLTNNMHMQRLKQEYDNYADILIVKRVDTHRDLNDKAVAMLDWLLEFCSQVTYVIHFIDDSYVNVGMFLEDLDKLGPSIYGAVAYRPPTVRDRKSRFYVSHEEYPYAYFPNYVTGHAYAFPNFLTKTLRCAIPNAIYIWIEDVWFTGHVRELAGIPAVHTKRREERFGRDKPNRRIKFEEAHEFILIHSVLASDMYIIHHHNFEHKQKIKV